MDHKTELRIWFKTTVKMLSFFFRLSLGREYGEQSIERIDDMQLLLGLLFSQIDFLEINRLKSVKRCNS